MSQIATFFWDSLRPDELLSVSEWADKHRFLSNKASAEPGRWRTDRTPYLREIMNCLSITSTVQEVIFMKGSQVGGTECGNNWIGYTIDHAPGPMMVVQPTLQMARRNSKQRVDPLIEESPNLLAKVGPKRSGSDAQNTLMEKEFPNGMLIMAGANSAAGLRSMPAAKIFFDEEDAYPEDVDGEGSPVDLAKARARTFSKRKFLRVSTPTTAGRSAIERAFEASDQRHFYVPCPHCDYMQVLEFQNLRWTSGEPETAAMECTSCQQLFHNWQKTNMLKKGDWRPKYPERSVRGYHLSSFYSPVGWFSWQEIAEEYEAAKDSTEKMRTFYNTILGETFKETTETPNWNRLYERRANYPRNMVPKGVGFLVCGVDVQRDRFELEIVGYCRQKVSYSIDYRVIQGDTSSEATWSKLSEVLFETFPMANNPNQKMGIKMMAVDSGYQTQTVYNWCRRYPSRVMAVKGQEKLNVIVGQPRPADVTIKGKTIRRGLKVWGVGVNLIKDEFYGWLRQDKAVEDEDDPYGFCHFPEYGPEFFKMLTAEEMTVKVIRGFKRVEYQKIRERNEALDCRVYARAAAAVCGLDRFTEDNWKALEVDFALPVDQSQPSKPKKKRKKESSWL